MPWNGSGTFTRQYGSTGWANDKAAGTKIVASRHDTNDDDLATGINNCITKDGQVTATADQPMGGFSHTGVGDAGAADEYPSAKQLQNSAFSWLTGVAGTDTITASAAIAVAAYAAGQQFRFVPAGANTGAVTLNLSGLGAKAVTKYGTTALVAGDIAANEVHMVVYDGTRFQLVNPASGPSVATGAAGTNTITATAAITAYAAGQTFSFLPANSNTAAATLNLSGLGAKNIKRPDLTDVAAGDLYASGVASVYYDGTQFQLMNARPALEYLGTYTPAAVASQEITLDFTNHSEIMILFTNIKPATDGTGGWQFRMGTAGTPDTGANYTYVSVRGVSGSATPGTIQATGQTSAFMSSTAGNADGRELSGEMWIRQIAAGSGAVRADFRVSQLTNAGVYEIYSGMGHYTNGAKSVITLFYSSGNITSGTIKVMGARK